MKLPYQYHHLAVDSAGKDRFLEYLWEAIETQFGKTGTAGIFLEFISTIHFAAVLLQYSTGSGHTLVEEPVLPLCTLTPEMGSLSVGIDICGENLAIGVIFCEATTRAAASTLCVFNWKTGKSKTVRSLRPSFQTSLRY